MQQITIQTTNFGSLKIQKFLQKEEIKFNLKVKTIGFDNGKLTLKRLLEVVCKYYKVEIRDVASSSRKRDYVLPRYVFIYLAYYGYRLGALHTIGGILGGRDHSSVIHGREYVNEALNGKMKHTEYNIELAKAIKSIIEIL